jgi:uncharacterized membrane protein
VIQIEGKQVPLPPGEWRLAGRAIDSTAPLRTVVSLVLVRLNGPRVDAAVLIQTNPLNASALWGKPSGCERTDLYFARIRYSSDHDGSCAYAAYVTTAIGSETVDPAWQQARLQAAKSGLQIPPSWMEVAYRITDPRDAIQVRYLFDPAASTPDALPAATIQALVSWTETNWHAVGSGFRNRLKTDAGEGLSDWPEKSGGPADASAAAPLVGAGASPVEYVGAKMVTYRIFGSMTDLSVNYLWLGSLPSATGLAVVSAMASSALYFVHELVWNGIERPAVLIRDLPGVGAEGPGPGRG